MANLYKSIRIGKLEVPGNLFLAPLAGYTDRAFRRISREMGADFTYTEMISSEAVVRGNDRTLELAERAPNEEIYGIQIFSGNAASAAGSVEKLLPFKPSLIDLNCGCPVPKIVKSGAGSALMQNPQNIRDIVKALVAASDVPVTVKIRTGWTSDTINFLEAAEMALEGGASLIAMHPRTRAQGYSGKSDWSCLTKLKQTFPEVPIMGSGDLYTGDDGRRMLEQTGIDALMFARGAIGNPFVFSETKANLLEESWNEPSEETKVEAAFKHFSYAVEYRGEERAVKEMRKHLCAYTKGITGGSAFRNRIVQGTSIEQYEEMFKEFLASLK